MRSRKFASGRSREFDADWNEVMGVRCRWISNVDYGRVKSVGFRRISNAGGSYVRGVERRRISEAALSHLKAFRVKSRNGVDVLKSCGGETNGLNCTIHS